MSFSILVHWMICIPLRTLFQPLVTACAFYRTYSGVRNPEPWYRWLRWIDFTAILAWLVGAIMMISGLASGGRLSLQVFAGVMLFVLSILAAGFASLWIRIDQSWPLSSNWNGARD